MTPFKKKKTWVGFKVSEPCAQTENQWAPIIKPCAQNNKKNQWAPII